jgi:hypothetical protein
LEFFLYYIKVKVREREEHMGMESEGGEGIKW